MAEILLAFPILAGSAILQSAMLSRMPLLAGTTDLTLLVVSAWALHERVRQPWFWAVVGGLLLGLTSGMPVGTYLAAYCLIVGVALIIRRRLWRIRFLTMTFVTIFGTLVVHGLSILVISLSGNLLPIMDSINLIVLPSLLLNLLLSLPVYVLVRDMANWLYPPEFDV